MPVGPILKSDAEKIAAEHAYHQGNRSFLWDGGPWGSTGDYVLAGVGDGRRTDFFLPNRNITTNSFTPRTYRPSTGATSQWTQGFSLHAVPGLLSFAPGSSPASGDEIQATYACQYLVNFAPEGIVLEQVATDLYLASLILIENAAAISPTLAESVRPSVVIAGANAIFAAGMTVHAPIRRITLAAQTQMAGTLTTSATQIVVGRTTVGSGAGEVTIGLVQTTSVNLSLVPNWNTTWLVSSKAVGAVNVKFGVEPGSGGGIIEWSIF